VPTADAHIETERPSRYLVQLCRQVSHQGRNRHLPRSDHRGDTHERPPETQVHVEWSDTQGIVSLPWGQCTMQAIPSTLTLRAEASDEENLQRVQDLVTGHLDRFSRRDRLTVTWDRRDAPGAQPAEATGTPLAPTGPTGQGAARRRRRRRMGLTAVGALGVAVHLGLGGAVLATSRWTGWAADIVLVLVLVKVIAIILGSHRLATRRTHKASDGPVEPSAAGDRPHPL
jgi:hypothetical protein